MAEPRPMTAEPLPLVGVSRAGIEESELDQIHSIYCGAMLFSRALERIVLESQLLQALGRYIQFNSVFGSGVANLAGEIGSRQDLFQDPQEPVAALMDRSVEVAADIFFAAVDEFGVAATCQRATHRRLAQGTLKAVAQYFGYDSVRLNQTISCDVFTAAATRKVLDGYGVNQPMDDAKIFRAIGFHLSSEILAHHEFHILDTFLRRKFPELVKALERPGTEHERAPVPGYHWIQIHIKLEAEHFALALRAADAALRYYAGAENHACVKHWILCGVEEFAALQSFYLERLLRE
jgi:hypothetical protein